MSFKKKLLLFVGALLILPVYSLLIVLLRSGETKVEITVVPADSSVSINGKAHRAGTAYLKPGLYTFLAKRAGFQNDSLTVRVAKEPVSIGLIPSPESKAAQEFLVANPDIQHAREAIGGQRASSHGLQVENKNPIITQLPYSDINGPFTIDYGPSKTRKDGVLLIISDSSPNGRSNALKWIKQQGYDPANLEILFYDFINPIDPNVGGE